MNIPRAGCLLLPTRVGALAGALVCLVVPLSANAADGLLIPQSQNLWPQWSARLSLHTSDLGAAQRWSPAALMTGTGKRSLLGQGVAPSVGASSLTGASLLGDYTFARPGFANFRASGGVLVGSQRAMSPVSASLGQALPQLGLSHWTGASNGGAAGNGISATLPYLGLGFSGTAWQNNLAFSADLGVVSERPSASAGVGRALFGNQGFDNALREMRLSPVLQLGLRYTF